MEHLTVKTEVQIVGLLSQMLIFPPVFLCVQLEVTEVTALCEVQGMDSPLVLSIVASKPKKLSVSFSLPGVWYLLSLNTYNQLHIVTVSKSVTLEHKI